jgi:hypothetical protein
MLEKPVRILRMSKKHIQDAPPELKSAIATSLVRDLASGRFLDNEAMEILCEMVVWLDESECSQLVCEAMVATTHGE